MISFTLRQLGALLLAPVFIFILLVLGSTASAAPPYAVTYHGTPTTSAMLDDQFTVNLKVTNTGTTVYSGVKVIINVPAGLSHTSVAPAGARIEENIITWMDVPIAAGKAFYPSVTLTFDDGVAIGDKLSLWVQVTGENMEANSQNFSITAVESVTTTTATTSNSGLVPQINAIHRTVYGRNPTGSEHTYWWGRVLDGSKATFGALLGAMQFHNLNGIQH